MTNRDQMLHEIDVVDFTLVDLQLYLDTHPRDVNALEYYSHYAKIKKHLCKEFARMFYPLTANEADCESKWTWGEAPLPWEGGCK